MQAYQTTVEALSTGIDGAIETEVKKLIYSGFTHEEQYPDWVANIFPMLEKNNKIRMCIDF